MTQFNKPLFGIIIIALIVLSLGYVLSPEDEDKGTSTVLLRIEFDDHGKLYSKNLTIWGGGR